MLSLQLLSLTPCSVCQVAKLCSRSVLGLLTERTFKSMSTCYPNPGTHASAEAAPFAWVSLHDLPTQRAASGSPFTKLCCACDRSYLKVTYCIQLHVTNSWKKILSKVLLEKQVTSGVYIMLVDSLHLQKARFYFYLNYV